MFPMKRSRSPGHRLSRSLSRSRSRSGSWSQGRRRNSIRRRERSRSRERSGSRRERQKVVYISNIPYDVRWMELKDIIREKAGDVSFVEMIEKDGKSKGCAVVEFKTREGATKCLDSMHRMEMGDRRLVVKEVRDPEAFFRRVREETGVDFLTNRSGANRSVISNMPAAPFGFETYGLSPAFLNQLGIVGPLCNRVFVANLPYNVSSSKLREIFSLAGQITDIDLQLDKDGKTKGMAVIEYFHPIEAVQAVSMLDHQRLFDRLLTVKMDRFEKTKEPRRPGELPVGLVSIGMGLGANGAPLANVAQLVASGNFGPVAPFVTPEANSMAMSSSLAAVPSSASPFLSGGGRLSPRPPTQMLADDYVSSIVRRDLSPPPNHSANQGGAYSTNQGVSHGRSVNEIEPRSMLATSHLSSYFDDAQPFSAAFAPRGGNGVDLPSSDFDFDFRERNRDHGERDRDRAPSATYLTNLSQKQQPQQQQQPFSRFYESPAAMAKQSVGYSNYSTSIPTGGIGSSSYDFAAETAPSRGSGGNTGEFQRFRPLSSPPINRSARPLRSILIRNLPLDYSWQTLRDRMCGFGEVEFADIIQPGTGKIRFKSAMHAEKATASLHGMLVEGRPITVDLVATD